MTLRFSETRTVKPRVLIFSFAYEPLIGGAEIAVRELTDRITDFDFDMVTLRFKREDLPRERIGNIEVYRTGRGSKYLYIFAAYRVARALHRKHAYSLTWSIMANYAGFAALFFKIRFPKVPFLLTLQEGDPIDYIKRRVRFAHPLYRSIFTRADQVTAISHYLAEFAKSMGHRREVSVIPNGVELPRFPMSATWVSPGTESITNPMLITTSRLVKKNGVDYIVKALGIMPESIRLTIVGDGPERERLERLTGELKVSSRVIFTGEVPHRDISQHLRRAHIFVRHSLSEGLGNSYLEAMSSGIPVVGTNVGGIVDFLRDGETGFISEKGNPESISKEVLFILAPENRAKVERVVKSGRALVERSFSWNGIVLDMRRVLESV